MEVVLFSISTVVPRLPVAGRQEVSPGGVPLDRSAVFLDFEHAETLLEAFERKLRPKEREARRRRK
jgi:hypothetical protein